MSAWFPNDDRDDRWYDTAPMPDAALHSAEGCAGDYPAVATVPRDWSGLLCAATLAVALISSAVIYLSGWWPSCIDSLHAAIASLHP